MRVVLLALLSAAACASRPVQPLTAQVENPPAKDWQPRIEEGPKKFDWIQLDSDEWLKGRIRVVREDKIQFDSDKLDNLSFDWEDIKQLRTAKTYTVVLANRDTYEGRLIIRDGRLLIGTKGGVREFKRDELMAIVPTSQKEWQRWSGNVGIGMTARSGNTDQFDITSDIQLIRRTPFSKVELRWIGNYSEVSGQNTVDNERFNGDWSLYLDKHWFVTPISVQLFRDPFQNIGLQVEPGVGGGYHIVDKSQLKWDVTLLAGVRYTEAETSTTGDATTTFGAIIPGTTLTWDITSKTDLEFSYNVSIGLPDTANTNQYLLAKLSVDLIGDLDLNVTFQWQRIGNPQPDASGTVPQKDDFWTTFGLAWEF